jgi:hypothetical protein
VALRTEKNKIVAIQLWLCPLCPRSKYRGPRPQNATRTCEPSVRLGQLRARPRPADLRWDVLERSPIGCCQPLWTVSTGNSPASTTATGRWSTDCDAHQWAQSTREAVCAETIVHGVHFADVILNALASDPSGQRDIYQSWCPFFTKTLDGRPKY